LPGVKPWMRLKLLDRAKDEEKRLRTEAGVAALERLASAGGFVKNSPVEKQSPDDLTPAAKELMLAKRHAIDSTAEEM
jgi:hypothetical protein